MKEKQRLVFIAGPYNGEPYQVERNVWKAREAAIALWATGFVAICPHLNSHNFGGVVPEGEFYKAYLEVLSRCDAVLMLNGSWKSKGATLEVNRAMELGLPVFESVFFLDRHYENFDEARPCPLDHTIQAENYSLCQQCQRVIRPIDPTTRELVGR